MCKAFWGTGQVAETTTPEAHAPLRGLELIRALGFWTLVAEDLRTHNGRLFSAGFAALFFNRYGTWADRFRFKPVRWPLMVPYALGQFLVQTVCGVELKRSVRVGRRLYLAHQHGIVIHQFAEIGDDVIIRHNVTFGIGSAWTWTGPKIGNRTEFSPGVVVIGDVTIGDDVSVGPNCTVSTDVPSGRTLFVPPPRSLPKAPPAEDAAEPSQAPAPSQTESESAQNVRKSG